MPAAVLPPAPLVPAPRLPVPDPPPDVVRTRPAEAERVPEPAERAPERDDPAVEPPRADPAFFAPVARDDDVRVPVLALEAMPTA
nr:hypothetical protein ISGA_07030 [Gordonia sp. NB41Y]